MCDDSNCLSTVPQENICNRNHKWWIQPDTEPPGCCLRWNAADRGYESLPLSKTAFVKDLSSHVQWQPNNPLLMHLQWKDRLPIFLSPVLEPGRWHLLGKLSLVLSLSANVWVYWCAVTGLNWSNPTCIKASCSSSSVCVCVLPQ